MIASTRSAPSWTRAWRHIFSKRGYAELPRGSLQASGCGPNPTLESLSPVCQDASEESLEALTRLVEASREWGGILVVSGAGISTESGIAGALMPHHALFHLSTASLVFNLFFRTHVWPCPLYTSRTATCHSVFVLELTPECIARLQVAGQASLQAHDPSDLCGRGCGQEEVAHALAHIHIIKFKALKHTIKTKTPITTSACSHRATLTLPVPLGQILGPQHDRVWPPRRRPPQRCAQRPRCPGARGIYQARHHPKR